jgi:hypothetical protein
LPQRTRFVAVVVLGTFKLILGGDGEEDGLLVFRIELGRGLSHVVAAAVVDAMEETTN